MEETRAKHLAPDALRAQLVRLREGWPAVRDRLTRHLLPFRNARAMLREAGCPSEPEQIGISRDRLRLAYEQAYYIRRRFTVLDVAMRTGELELALDELFEPRGDLKETSAYVASTTDCSISCEAHGDRLRTVGLVPIRPSRRKILGPFRISAPNGDHSQRAGESCAHADRLVVRLVALRKPSLGLAVIA